LTFGSVRRGGVSAQEPLCWKMKSDQEAGDGIQLVKVPDELFEQARNTDYFCEHLYQKVARGAPLYVACLCDVGAMIFGQRNLTAVGIQAFNHLPLECSLVLQSTPLKSAGLLAQHW